MSKTLNAFDHENWERQGLKSFEDFSEYVEYCNQIDCGDCTEGLWYFMDDEPLSDGRRVIYHGSFGNYNSPGASAYTYAEIYDPDEDFEAAVYDWENRPEYLEDDEEDTSDEEEDDDSYE